jgi:hypothetical protein
MSAHKQWVVPIEIPKAYSSEFRKAIGQSIVEYIRERSDKGLDKNNKSFPKYSIPYTKSLDFKVSGKSKKVDLKLSGDMLAALQVISDKPGEIRIGYKKGIENDKAEGNIIGSYGRPKGNGTKARDFLGITSKDLKSKVLKDFPLEIINKETEEMLRLAREGKDKELNNLDVKSKDQKIIIKLAKGLYNE